ncbi:MAG: Hsp20/alpha crystallin family protein [Methanomethylovorans sp.]|nr:Hsp20/alpha crystallin family protein [Methanomethylovorans sp.]
MADKGKKKDKIKTKGSFEGFFGPGYFVHIEHLIDKMIENMGPGFDRLPVPLVYGFSVVGAPEDETRIREFGSLPLENATEVFGEGSSLVQKRKPLVDIVEKDGKIYITAELPGISTGEIILKATDSSLDLKASHGGRKYAEQISLSTKVDPESATATYRNGVLEVVLKILNSDKTVLVHVE